jgi:cobalt-zinc-cadmium efflux system membrane fusion protein
MKFAIYIVISLLLFSSCGSKKEELRKEAPQSADIVSLTAGQYQNAGIVVGRTEQKHISSTIRVNGQIDVPPQNLVSVSFPLGGYLKSTSLLPGMQVRKGEPIAVIEDQQFIQIQREYLSAKARQSYLEHEYNRQKELNISKASSDKVFQQAEADYKENLVTIKALAEKLRLIGLNPDRLTENNISRVVNMVAPITGFVSRVNVNVGKYVNPTDVLFEIVNPDDIHLRLAVFEKDVAQLAIGQKVIAYSANNPEKKYDCEVILIGRDVSADRSIDVHCHFRQFDKALVPGMYMVAEVELANSQSLAVPDDAIVRYDNKTYVFVPAGERQFRMVPVQVGAAESGYTAITWAEPATTDKIVVKNAYTLLMKMKNTDAGE